MGLLLLLLLRGSLEEKKMMSLVVEGIIEEKRYNVLQKKNKDTCYSTKNAINCFL